MYKQYAPYKTFLVLADMVVTLLMFAAVSAWRPYLPGRLMESGEMVSLPLRYAPVAPVFRDDGSLRCFQNTVYFRPVRLAVPPGITAWWQVSGRSDLTLHLNTQYDLYYARNFSLLLSIKIVLKTVLLVLRGEGAF